MIETSQKIPNVSLTLIANDGFEKTTTDDLFGKGRFIVFGLPGAFTPVCSSTHVPGFVKLSAELKEKGIDKIYCLSVNDAYVMKAWAENLKTGSDVIFLADGNGDFTKALGLEFDLREHNMGIRSKRYSMIIENGTVSGLHLEPTGACDVSSAETLLKSL